MPDRFTLPTTPEQWAAVPTNETDARLRDAWWDKGFLGTEAFDQEQLAAASRLLERERCVERLAEWLATDGPMRRTMDGHEVEARRILEDK